MLAAGIDGFEILARIILVLAVAAPQQLGETEDGVHWRANVMAHVGEEFAFRSVGGLSVFLRLAEFDLVFFELGHVVEANQCAASLAAGSEHRRAVDDEGVQLARRIGQPHDLVALRLTRIKCTVPRHVAHWQRSPVARKP